MCQKCIDIGIKHKVNNIDLIIEHFNKFGVLCLHMCMSLVIDNILYLVDSEDEGMMQHVYMYAKQQSLQF